MQAPEIPIDETARLVSLNSMRILDTAAENRFDRITSMASRVFNVEICLVSLVDSDRQWFKSTKGLDARETSREISFCGHAILKEEVFVIEDTHSDPRFANNPLVVENPGIRFYAGYPVHAPDGHRIGTLCLIDKSPRSFSDKEIATLRDFAALVDDEFATSSKIHVDELTQVANRRGFTMVAEHLLPLSQRIQLGIELFYFDLNNFKSINDEFGHSGGDRALQLFARVLLKSYRRADVVARLGGDEFAVLMVGTSAFTTRGLQCMKDLLQVDESEFSSLIHWSVGRARYVPDLHVNIEGLLADADTRMYAQKFDRRNKASESPAIITP